MKFKYKTFYLILIFIAFLYQYQSALIAQKIDLKLITVIDTAKGGEDLLSHPVGLSVNPSGQIYLSDTGNHRLVKFDSKLNFLEETGGFGWSAEQFDHPMGVNATNGLDVFVADHRNERIVRYDKNLHYISTYTSDSDLPEHLQFGFPIDVVISSQGELYLLDGENSRILKLDVMGNPQLSFGDFDSGEGVLQEPKRIIIDQYDNILVADPGTQRVMKYDMLGNFLYYYTHQNLKFPSGIITIGDMVLISDLISNKIFVFLNDGSLYKEIGPGLSGGITLQHPVDLAFYIDRLYILDSEQNSIFIMKWSSSDGDPAD